MPDHDDSLDWSEDGAPRSKRFGDVYFSAEDGLAESRAVFLEGCGLPGAWRGCSSFVVGELGFGTGLNILALLDLWRRERPAPGRLKVFSVEAYPLGAEAARRALSRWPELADLAEPLLAQWPQTPGFHRIDFPELGATLDVAIAEAADALSRWTGRADAWFLDGFAPSTNPDMWREELMRVLAQRSSPDARVATFTVAGDVRRGLAAQGFEVAKRPGFGRKRERLEATLPGIRSAARDPGAIAIVGGGIAGGALARAFANAGYAATVLAPNDAGASGNDAALVTPRFDAAGGPIAEFFAQGRERAGGLYRREVPAALVAEGVVQLEHQARDAARFDRIAAQDLWADGGVLRLSADEASERIGERTERAGLWLRDALAIAPRTVLDAWIGLADHIEAEVAGLERAGDGWRLIGVDGSAVFEAKTVCLAAGWGLRRLAPSLPLSPVRGQATFAPGVELKSPVAWGGYATPALGGVLYGATHDRGEADAHARDGDDRRNLESLAAALPGLAARLADLPVRGRAAVRAVTPDRLPIAGSLAQGLFVLGGLGSRGFATAPLLAEHVAALALEAPSPLPAHLAGIVDVARYSGEQRFPRAARDFRFGGDGDATDGE